MLSVLECPGQEHPPIDWKVEGDHDVVMQVHKKQAPYFNGLRAVSFGGLKIVPFAPRARIDKREQSRGRVRDFSDRVYVQHLIRHLRDTRKEQGIGIAKVAKRAGLKRGIIERAEMGCFVPTTRDFKAWSGALGMRWCDVWSAVMPTNRDFERH